MSLKNTTNNSIAVCGIDCNKCPVFIATVKNDFEPLKDFAARGSKKWNQPESFFMKMKCWGCQQDEMPRVEYCSDCNTRNCARSKGYENCAYCNKFESCIVLEEQNNLAIQPSRENLIFLRKKKGLS